MTDKNKVGTFGAGILGAAIGAAAGVAATKIMSDPEMKTKAVDAFQKAKQYALDGVEQVKKRTQDWQGTAEDTVAETKNKLGKAASRNAKAV